MNILYIGDIMGRPGREVVRHVVPSLRRELSIDLVVGQAENVSHGKSMSDEHMRELLESGVDFFTGGNHTTKRPSLHQLLADPSMPVVCPANLQDFPENWGVKEIATTEGPVVVISLLGQLFPQSVPIDNPLQVLDKLLSRYSIRNCRAIVVNFHGDLSSEKRVIGYYADGRVSMMIGDHWHVPTADALVLPKGTAHITDVGMCGTLHSSLGVELEMIVQRWRDEVKTPNRIATDAPYQFNAVLVETDEATHLATKITTINKILENLV